MKRILLNIFLGCCLCACSDFLQPDSPSEYVPETVDALNELLLGGAYPTSTVSTLFCFHNSLDDDIEMCDKNISYLNTQIENMRLVYSWDPEMFELTPSTLISPVWSAYYTCILGANAALDYLGDVKGSEGDKAYVRAQACALRAFYYFNLVNLFGEPYSSNKEADGVPLKLTSDLSDSFDARKTVEEVYEQIVKDLDIAEKNFLTLPVEQQNKGNYRLSLPAVQLLRARVCLYMKDMKGAAEYAQKVINDWNYDLYDLNSFSADSATEVFYPNYVTVDNPETIWAYGNVTDVWPAFLKVSGFLEDGKTTACGLNASRDLIDCFKEGDLRKKWYLVSELQGTKPVEGHYLIWSKCSITSNHTVLEGKVFGLSLRLSEAYLILAEAVYDSNQELALKMINDLRRKRYTGEKYEEVNYSGEELLSFIREERRRELCFEGQRWFDLRRYGMPSFEHRWVEHGVIMGSYVIEEGDAAYTLPIPAMVMERNLALRQNKLTTPKTLQ